MTPSKAIWVKPGATRFSCLCERCLDAASLDTASFLDAVGGANVRGMLPSGTDTAVVRCASGHELIVRRVDRPPELARRRARQRVMRVSASG